MIIPGVTSSNNLEHRRFVTPVMEYLVVAGGGPGGFSHSGAGGAGGYRTGELMVYKNTTMVVTVGAGGTASTFRGDAPPYGNGPNGNNSTFHTVTSLGGGAGGSTYTAGSPGGSGGGAGVGNAGGLGTEGQGFEGGGPGGYFSGGGGGGASIRGRNSGEVVANQAGFGGDGATTPISGGSLTGLGAIYNGSYFFSGGGGGGCYSGLSGGVNFTSGNGGIGGGGKGSNGGAAATSGSINTGGGGGGGGYPDSLGGNGGSGVVIVRYSDFYPAAQTYAGSPYIYQSGGYRYYAFISSGSITL